MQSIGIAAKGGEKQFPTLFYGDFFVKKGSSGESVFAPVRESAHAEKRGTDLVVHRADSPDQPKIRGRASKPTQCPSVPLHCHEWSGIQQTVWFPFRTSMFQHAHTIRREQRESNGREEIDDRSIDMGPDGGDIDDGCQCRPLGYAALALVLSLAGAGSSGARPRLFSSLATTLVPFFFLIVTITYLSASEFFFGRR